MGNTQQQTQSEVTTSLIRNNSTTISSDGTNISTNSITIKSTTTTKAEGNSNSIANFLADRFEAEVIRLWVRFFSTETEENFREFLRLFKAYFEGVNKIDVLMGFLILRSYYVPQHIDTLVPITSDELQEGMYYCKLSCAAYGWKLIELLIEKSVPKTISSIYTKVTQPVEEEIRKNVLSYTRITGFAPETILHANWFSSHMSPAHIIMIDHKKKEIIVSIRGTMDIVDALADAICTYATFDDKRQTHKGMLDCAHTKLKEIKILLLELYSKNTYTEGDRTHHYKIVFTGHSLGAGTAALMVLLLNNEFPFLNARAIVFSCPPVLDLESANETWNTITNYICRNDIIPRLTMGSLIDLKHRIKLIMAENPDFAKQMWQLLAAGASNESALKKKMDSWIGQSGIDMRSICSVKSTDKIYTPGKVIFLNKKKDAWGAELMPNHCFDEILTVDNMFRDHFPDQVYAHLQSTINNVQNEENIKIKEKLEKEASGVAKESAEVEKEIS